jgi:hypothetical protein
MIVNPAFTASNIRNTANDVAFIPAKLDAAMTAKILGFQEHEIPVLVSHELLEPLGKPPVPNCRKYFARRQIMELADNVKWLSKATNVLYGYWQKKNANRKSAEPETESSHAE